MRRSLLALLILAGCTADVPVERGPVAGALCGDPRLVGTAQVPVTGPGACGMADPVRLSGVAGITVAGRPTMTCRTARAFADWAEGGLQVAAARDGRQVTEIVTVASFACRNRNGTRTRRLSNHALGQAIDISALGFADGGRLSVLSDWTNSTILQEAAGRACGPFNTVLGPNYNAAHRDHLHFDVTDEYGGGTFCR
ncbi:extensin-like domain-containing protein [Pontivivens insulae]|uniref:Extensin-like C-terminal domain-containing protein n=1 Tax=Pontivivens insulae TaxID=1639689 RepID=A0A2R8A911_9RHOB|nr:extensin family protein [Pontivivens insulae]RED18620.1 extensin-like protein [Pontivivens insulae]SPF28518.1 hypothetical protein POI8812_00819 [Pontivivens insulae]